VTRVRAPCHRLAKKTQGPVDSGRLCEDCGLVSWSPSLSMAFWKNNLPSEQRRRCGTCAKRHLVAVRRASAARQDAAKGTASHEEDEEEDEADEEEQEYAIGFELEEPFLKHICGENETVMSVLAKHSNNTKNKSAPTRDEEEAAMVDVNRKRLYSAVKGFGRRSLMLAGSVLLVPATDPERKFSLRTRVTRYIGYFNVDAKADSYEELWEATDDDGQVYRIDEPALYHGMGYRVEPTSDRYMGRFVRRPFGAAGDSIDGKVVAHKPAARGGDGSRDPALWLLRYDDGDREDLEEHEVKRGLVPAAAAAAGSMPNRHK
jgi:hypothetical protein